MRKLLITCLFLISVFIQSPAAKAQVTGNSDSCKNCVHFIQETGLQANYFFRQFIKPANADSLTNPFFFSYKLTMMPCRLSLRTGVGYHYDRSEKLLVDVTRIDVDRSFDLRLGLEKQFRLTKHVKVFLGADWIYGNSKKVLSTYNNIEVVTISDLSTWNGVGPVAGINLKIGKNFSLMTETSLYYISGTTKSSTKFSSNILDNMEDLIHFQSAKWLVPNVIYFVVHF